MKAKMSGNGALKAKSEINEEVTDAEAESTDSEEISTDDLFHLLQNERRRRVVKYLSEHDEGEGVDMRDVVEWVAAKEHDTTVQQLRSKERQRVYIALYQSHLPKLDDAGVIEYDQRKGWIERTEFTPLVEQYVDGAERPAEVGDEEESGGRSVRTDSVATGVGALLLVAGYSGFVPAVSGFIVSVGLFALIAVMAVSRVLPDR